VGDEVRLWPATTKLSGTPQVDNYGGIVWDTSRLSEGVLVVKGIDTGIMANSQQPTADNQKVYDLSGRQTTVDNGRKPKAGIYVRGGKKVVIR